MYNIGHIMKRLSERLVRIFLVAAVVGAATTGCTTAGGTGTPEARPAATVLAVEPPKPDSGGTPVATPKSAEDLGSGESIQIPEENVVCSVSGGKDQVTICVIPKVAVPVVFGADETVFGGEGSLPGALLRPVEGESSRTVVVVIRNGVFVGFPSGIEIPPGIVQIKIGVSPEASPEAVVELVGQFPDQVCGATKGSSFSVYYFDGGDGVLMRVAAGDCDIIPKPGDGDDKPADSQVLVWPAAGGGRGITISHSELSRPVTMRW